MRGVCVDGQWRNVWKYWIEVPVLKLKMKFFYYDANMSIQDCLKKYGQLVCTSVTKLTIYTQIDKINKGNEHKM